MSRLFLKERVKKQLILCAILMMGNTIFANDTIVDYSFREHCKASDAYLLYSFTDVVYSRLWNSYAKQITVRSKLVVNNKTGVEKYAFLNFDQSITNRLREITIKTLKADGTVVKSDSNLISKLIGKENKLGLISHPIAGVEPGDTIETYYTYGVGQKKYEMRDFVNLYNSVPSLNTEFTVRANPNFTIRYKSYNGFPEPQILSNDTLVYCAFKMENIKGLSENQYTCLACELPYLFYSLENKNSELRTWKEVYNQEFNFITQPILLDYQKSSYYKKWKKKVIGDAKDSSKYYQLNLLHEDIFTNIQIDEVREKELIKSSGYFLKEKRFDPMSIRRLYRQILEDLEIKYWAVFARSKRMGKIDPYYIRKGEFDHIFFAYENEQGALELLYPHIIAHKYLINEIPTALYNTEAVIARPYLKKKIKRSQKFINYDLKVAEVDSVTVNMIRLPGMSANRNFVKQVLDCDVDLDTRSTTFKSRFSMSGGLSTDIRSFFRMLNQNKEMSDFYDALSEYEGDDNPLEIDTIIGTNFTDHKPFLYSITAEGKLKETLSFLNDSLISISIDKLLRHSQVESDLDSTQLNYYLDYCYTDFCLIILKFPCEVEVLGLDKYNKNFKNQFGEYLFSLNLAGKNQLIFRSNYKVIKDMILKEDYGELKKMNDLLQEIKSMRVMVKLKSS